MFAWVILLTLTNAFSGKERIPSASQLVGRFYAEKQQGQNPFTLETAVDQLTESGKLPKEVLSLLHPQQKHQKRLRSGLLEKHQIVFRGPKYTAEDVQTAREKLNAIYDTEQSDLDISIMQCTEFDTEQTKQINENTRERTTISGQTAAARAKQLFASKSLKESGSETDNLDETFKQHRDNCKNTLAAARAQLAIAEADHKVGLKIQAMTECDDAQIAAAVAQENGATLLSTDIDADNTAFSKARLLMECHSKSNEITYDFGAQVHAVAGSFKSKIAWDAMQRMAKLSLDRELGRHAYPSLVQGGQEPAAELPSNTTEEAPPPIQLGGEFKCNVNAAPNCPLLADSVSQMVGEIYDSVVAIKKHIDTTKAECEDLSEQYSAQMLNEKGLSEHAQIDLAMAVKTIDTSQLVYNEMTEEFTSLTKELKKKRKFCEETQAEIMNTMCGIKVARLEIANMAEDTTTVIDCEVSEWSVDECSAKCAGGSQVLRREVIRPTENGASCPPLEMERDCNTDDCPIDCELSEWSGWGKCSLECGGGLALSFRNVVTQPSPNGMPCEQTTNSRECGADACNEDCELGDWNEWSGCSKACNSGIQTRRKQPVRPPKGEGHCADENSAERFDQIPCNDHTCPDNLVCNSQIDLVLLLDGSGSVGSKGFANEQKFGADLLKKMVFTDDRVKASLIRFSSKVDIIASLSDDLPTLVSDVEGMAWPARTTATAAAFERARVVLKEGRKEATSVVFVVTDGMPNDSEATATMAEKVKADGVRLVFVAVGKNLDMNQLYQWASFPPEQNVLTAKKFKKLGKKLQEYVSDICPTLACMEDMTGNGVDYQGCQTRTKSGQECQMWDKMVPRKHTFSYLGNNNYCRNPDGRDAIGCVPVGGDADWEECEPRGEGAFTTW